MEKQQDDILMKSRSYRGVITAGLRLYTGSFRRIFKATWLYTLIFVLLAAAMGALLTTHLLPVGLQMLALPQYKWLIAQEHLPLIGIVALLFVTSIVFMIILWRTTGRCMNLFHSLKQILKPAGRHWLLTLLILLAGFIVLIPVCLFVSLPVIILTTASLQAQAGTLMGDPLGMPSYIMWLAAGTWLLAAFLQVYILLSLLFVAYYAYGSVETQRREREQQKLSIQ